MSERKLCDHWKIKHPAKHLIQYDGYYLLVCADCSKELNKIPNEKTVCPDINKVGFYEAEYPEI